MTQIQLDIANSIRNDIKLLKRIDFNNGIENEDSEKSFSQHVSNLLNSYRKELIEKLEKEFKEI